MGEDIDVLYDFIHSGYDASRNFCDCNIRDDGMLKNFDRTNGDYNEFWKSRDYIHQLDKMKAALLMAHAFNDWNVMPSHSTHVYRELKKRGVPSKLYLHQGGHGGDPPFEAMNRWFTRWLCGVENGVEADAPFMIVREGDKRSEPTTYADWPNPDATPVVLRPRAGGLAVGALVADASPDTAKETLVDNVEKTGAALAKAAKSEHRLLYALPTLAAPLHISGTPKLTIRLSCDKPAANLSVWLVSLPWNGGRNVSGDIVTRGWADPRNHAAIDRQSPLEPGRFYDLTFELESDDQVIPAGERLALMIFSSDRDFTLWPEAGTKLTVDLAGTSLELPIVGGAEAVAAATAPATDASKN
jgi:X-Pro dipeptidyl-peptidase